MSEWPDEKLHGPVMPERERELLARIATLEAEVERLQECCDRHNRLADELAARGVDVRSAAESLAEGEGDE